MKKFGTLKVTLMMVTVTVMVYARSILPAEKQEMLKQIREFATDAKKHVGMMMNLTVTFTPREDEKTCVSQFFCWAGQNLIEPANYSLAPRSLKKLKTSVDVYNNMTGIVDCPLLTNHTYDLLSFLKDIETCTKF